METHRRAKRVYNDVHDHQLIETLLMKDVVRSFAWLYPSDEYPWLQSKPEFQINFVCQ